MTQEIFLRAWAKRESLQSRASLRTWLYRIATNACLDFLEKRRDRTPISTELQGASVPARSLWPRLLPHNHDRAGPG
jgi:DNA-directed RNA polymerase specialized sigma24 family protein